ncbi:MAG: hypothetical protein LBK60_07085 [Verrucomicrobiales bacterium]|jgi:hypothetical protein|nr:hypothetical protein [Verrucomicrobiales bacterium]
MSDQSSANQPKPRPRFDQSRPQSAPRAGRFPPRVVIPEPAAADRRKLTVPLWLWGGLGLLVLTVAALTAVWLMQETRVTFHVDSGDLVLTEPPAIVYNFTGQVDLLRSDYSRRVAPIDLESREVQNNLAAVRADLAGKLEAKRLLKNELERLDMKIPEFIADTQHELTDLWAQQGGELDREYVLTEEEYQQKLVERARQLGLDYRRNQDIDFMDVSVNAFKLALYGMPKTVNAEAERQFAEDLLAEWQKYQEDWQKRMAVLKAKSQDIRKQPAPKIEEVRERMAKVTADLALVDVDVAAYQLELRQYERRAADLNTQLREVTRQFMDHLLVTPNEFVKTRLSLGENGFAELRDLGGRKEEFPPGDYWLLVTAVKDERTYWALKKFSIEEHRRQLVNILPGDFTPVTAWLNGNQP